MITNPVRVLDLAGRKHFCFTAATNQTELELWAQTAAMRNPKHVYFFEHEEIVDRAGMVEEMIADLTTPLGGRLRLYPAVQNGVQGVMLHMSVKQPGDSRHAEIWLSLENIEAVQNCLDLYTTVLHLERGNS